MILLNTQKIIRSAKSGLLLVILILVTLFIESIAVDSQAVSPFIELFQALSPLFQLYLQILLYFGFVMIANFQNASLLRWSAYGVIAYQIIFYLIQHTFELSNTPFFLGWSYLISSILFGVLNVSLGISLIFIEKKSSKPSTITGIITLCFGLTYISVHYAYLATSVLLFLYLVHSVLLYKIAKNHLRI